MAPNVQVEPTRVEAQPLATLVGQSVHELAPFFHFPEAQVVTAVAVHVAAPVGQTSHV
jgi:hypothetical protein